MNNQNSYKVSSKNRRLHPRIWDVDYCLLRGLANEVRRFASVYSRSDITILDYGCGTKPYQPLFPEDCNYIGIDIYGNPLADIIIDPGRPVELPDGIADLIISTQVVYKIPDFQSYLSECHRLLRPNGLLFLSTHGTWTFHPGSNGDYYRFTQDGLRYVLTSAIFYVDYLSPVVGTLGCTLHIRQLVFNSWVNKLFGGNAVAKILNIYWNLRILIEDHFSPKGTRMSCPVILVCVARRI